MVQSDVAVLYRDVVRVRIVLSEPSDEGIIYYIGPAPADTRSDFHGSGLPFANPQQAFDNPTIGAVQQSQNDGSYMFDIQLPNSYYTDVGNKLIRPHLNISYYTGGTKRNVVVNLNYHIPYRTLYPYFYENDPLNYAGRFDLPIMNQEQIYRSYAHPETIMPTESQNSYWGMKPPPG